MNKNSKRIYWMLSLFGIGFISGVMNVFFKSLSSLWNENSVLDTMSWILRILYILLGLASAYYYDQSNRLYLRQELEEEEEESQKSYLKTFRYQGIATFSLGIAFAIVLPLFMMTTFLFKNRSGHMELMLLGIDFFLVCTSFLLSYLCMKNLKLTRGFAISIFSTPKEGLSLIYKYDEGERTIYFEEFYKALYRLNVQIFPLLYLLIFYCSIEHFQFLALFIVLGLQGYLNIVQYIAVRKFYK